MGEEDIFDVLATVWGNRSAVGVRLSAFYTRADEAADTKVMCEEGVAAQC